MSKSQFSKVLTGAVVSAILSSGVALAQDQAPKSATNPSNPTEKNGCKSSDKKTKQDKNSCSGKDGCGQKESKKDKNSCSGKDGCGQKESKKDKNSCAGKDGCGQKK